MKKGCFILLLLSYFAACKEKKGKDQFTRLAEFEKAASTSRLRSDTIFLGFVFGQTPESFLKHFRKLEGEGKLYKVSYDNDTKYKFYTGEDYIKEIQCGINVKFDKGRLYELSLYSDPHTTKDKGIAKIFMSKQISEKYGVADTRIQLGDIVTNDYWFRNNLRVSVREISDAAIIAYTDMTIESEVNQREKSETEGNGKKTAEEL